MSLFVWQGVVILRKRCQAIRKLLAHRNTYIGREGMPIIRSTDCLSEKLRILSFSLITAQKIYRCSENETHIFLTPDHNHKRQ